MTPMFAEAIAPTTLKKAAAVMLFGAVLSLYPASAQAETPRMKAFKACAAQISTEFGKGKMIDAKSKRLKSGYAVTMTKLDPNGDFLAKVSCQVKKGNVISFDADRMVQVAKK